MQTQNLSLFRVFLTVAKCSSLSKAARQLYMSQPAVSKSVTKLEEELSCQLFLRSSHGIQLTEEGRILLERVQEAFRALHLAENELSEYRENGMGSLSIGVSTTLCRYILLPYLKDFVREFPQVKVRIQNQASGDTVRMLERGEIDLGVIVKPRSPLLSFYPVREIHDVFVSSPSYLEHAGLKDADESIYLESASVLLLPESNYSRQHVDDYLRSEGLRIRHPMEVSTMDLLIEFAKTGLGVGCCIRECVTKELEEGELTELPMIRSIPSRIIGFATRTEGPVCKSSERFLQWFREKLPFSVN